MSRLKYPRLSNFVTSLNVVRCCLPKTIPIGFSPKMTLQQLSTHMTLSRGALYVLIFRSSVETSNLNQSCRTESDSSPC